MTNHVRWGILGAAKFAREHMGPAINGSRGGVLSAIASSSAAKAAPFEEIAPGIRVFDSYDALLAAPEIDAIYIPLPNALHVEWTEKAAAAGKHVLCEKPIAMDRDGISRLIEARERSGKLIAEAWMIAHHPQYRKARELLQDGAIGPLVRVDSTHSFFNADMDNIRNRPETGGGALGDIGVYAFGAIRLLTGQDAQNIIAAQIERINGVDVSAHVMAQFESFVYTGRVSMRAAPWQEITLHGQDGVIRMPVPFNAQVFGEARVELHRPGGHVETWGFARDNHYLTQVETFNKAVLGQADWPLPLEDSGATRDFLDAIIAAAGN